ncbi:MAG: heme ABC transporter ATP-binding protein [Bifidobacteriaceae bacterium]|jgi:iron complex transport system ATP-binding protein|nr:heme ABC transporter ATP-binding protein [Bifidobacteriaceae bacterium]
MAALLAARAVEYAVGQAQILKGIDLAVRPGEILALAGPNGAGKSTLLAVLAGDLRPTRGQVTLDGQPLHGIGVKELARKRAVMLQEAHVSFPFSVADVVRMGRAPWGGSDPAADDAAVAAALAATDTLGLARRVFQTLSGGEKARVAFARTLAQDSQVLLLDEPTAALDIRHQELVMSLARRQADQGRAVLAVLHGLTLAAAWADRLALIGGGRLAGIGPVVEVATPERLSELYQHPIRVELDPATGLPVVAPKRGALVCAV